MYNNRFFCIALLTIVFSIGLIFHTAEADGISISSGSDIYYLGDYIVIFGTVDTIATASIIAAITPNSGIAQLP